MQKTGSAIPRTWMRLEWEFLNSTQVVFSRQSSPSVESRPLTISQPVHRRGLTRDLWVLITVGISNPKMTGGKPDGHIHRKLGLCIFWGRLYRTSQRHTTKQNYGKSQKLTSQNQIKLGRNSTDMCVSFKLPTHEQRDWRDQRERERDKQIECLLSRKKESGCDDKLSYPPFNFLSFFKKNNKSYFSSV